MLSLFLLLSEPSSCRLLVLAAAATGVHSVLLNSFLKAFSDSDDKIVCISIYVA